jgi:hypothetical protein
LPEKAGREGVKHGVSFARRLAQVLRNVKSNPHHCRLWFGALFVVAGFALAGATVTTLDGKSYEGEVFLEPDGAISVTLGDSGRKKVPLSNVKVATFSSPQLSIAQFSHIAEGWTNVDIGEVSIAGVAGQSNGLFAIQVASADVGGKADALHYVCFRTSDDVDLVARIVSIGGADRMARAGVMLRDSLKPEAKCIFAGVNAAGGLTVQHRADSAKPASSSPLADVALPCWLKISRREKSFTVYRSQDGKQWEQIGAAQLSIKQSGYYAGLAVTSHSGYSFCTAMIYEVARTIAGVRGEYFADKEFSNLVTNRIEPTINYHWVGEPPAPGLKFNNFSVRWSGELEPKYSEAYTFYFDAEDAALWVNDHKAPHIPLRRETRMPPGATPFPLLLKAGNRYPFKFEYRHTGFVRNPVRVGWSSQSQGREILPGSRLFCTVPAVADPGKRLTAPAWVMGRGIMLRNGTFIAGGLQSISESGVKFTYRGDIQYTVPLHQVARAIFRVSPRNGMLSTTDLPSGALLGNGDFIEGQVQFGSGRSVKISSVLLGLRSFNLESGELAALVLNDPSPLSARYELRLGDNSVLVANSIHVEQDEVRITEPVIGAMRVPRELVTEVRAGERLRARQ